MSPTGKPWTRRRVCATGFTLVEVLVVVVIIAVLAGMAALDFAGSAGSLRLRESARQAYHMARYARAFAVSRGQRSRVVFDRSRRQVSMLVESDDANSRGQWQAWTADMMRPWTLPRGVDFAKVMVVSEDRGVEASAPGGASGDARPGAAAEAGPTSGGVVEFRPNGTADAAMVVLSAQGQAWSLSIAPATGRVDLTQGTLTQPPDQRRDLDLGS